MKAWVCMALTGAIWLSSSGLGPGFADDKTPEISDAERVRQLATSRDKAVREQAASALGDRAIAGTVVLTDQDRKTLNQVVAAAIAAAASPRDRNESELQIQRLWSLAIPALLDGMDRNETFSFSTRMLTVMRDEAVVKAVIEKARTNKDPNRNGLYRFALGGMKGATRPRIAGRSGIDEAEADRLYRELIEPALETLP